ncbi:IclR family transcriptional regulator [Secundilactobacillus collinoides]|uniref:IclR family transcriptional regulator n=2 Tax=Secundilactobacillus collinoides TaxID=33960 RepID=A0A0R2BF66_SECCO|nr:IclR family transcriptional regulator [Secundilactobacillus collinoides]KRM77520.1 hypothetical protein FC82_GL002875 [Secundilactobacillus collinoides DSM 20515 = JCM 1123]KZL43215.1 hypothetical protein TY91_01005 [Secundilactobacillus collinoides]
MTKPIQSVERATRIIDYLAERPETKISELSTRLGISKTTLFGIAETLCQDGVLYKNPLSSGYSIGSKFIRYAKPLNNDQLIRLLTPYLQVVCNEFGEDIYLAIIQDQHVHYIATIEADLPQHKKVPTTTDDFLYNTAAGKMMLSSFLPAELTVYLDQLHESGKLTEPQVRDLNRDLTKVRQDNLSYDLGGQSPDINCVAVGIRNSRHEILASMAVLMQRNEDVSERMAAIAERMQAISAELEQRLI